jgi:2'-5' RNA ligase
MRPTLGRCRNIAPRSPVFKKIRTGYRHAMRAFVAIGVGAAAAEALQGVMHGVAGARWQTDAQLHLTLRFLGEADRWALETLAAGLARIDQPGFDIVLTGAGHFSEGSRAGSLWIGVAPSDPLARLHAKVERIAVAAGFPPERRAFLPHVTIARMPRRAGPVADYCAAIGGRRIATMRVDRVGLYESTLGAGGSSYQLLDTVRLPTPTRDGGL